MKDLRDAFFDEVAKIAFENEDIVILTDDFDVFSLMKFKEAFPHRYINIGVAEQNMINVAAGLSSTGKRVLVCGISSFVIFRCYEQIKFNICSMNLPVTIVGVGVGFSFGFDGPTHHAIQDLSIVRSLPEMSIYNPSDSTSAKFAAQSVFKSDVPSYVRIDKEKCNPLYRHFSDFDNGYSLLMHGQGDVVVVTTGTIVHQFLKDIIPYRTKYGLIDIFRIKPVNEEKLNNILSKYNNIVCVEENAKTGGLGDYIFSLLNKYGTYKNVKHFSLPDIQCFSYGDRNWLNKTCKLDMNEIISYVS